MSGTRVVITADTTQAQRAMLSLGQSIDGATRNFLNLGGVAGKFAGVLTLGALTAYGKSIINLQDDLASLGKVYGLTAREMSGLKFAAEQNGSSLDEVASAAKNLAVNMAAAPDKFAKLGITAKDSTGALAQVADLVAQVPDGMQKAALLTELFGKKVGPELVEFLSQGGDSMRAFIERGKEIYQVTDENAAKAKEFNDQLNELQARGTGLGIALVSNVLPGLTKIATAMADTAREAGLLQALLVGLGGVFTAVFTDDMLEREQKIAKDLKSLRAEQETLLNLRNERPSWLPQPLGNDKKINEISEKMLALEKELLDIQKQKAKLDQSSKNETPKSAQDLLNGLNSGGDNNALAVASLQEEAFRKEMDTLGVAAAQVKVYELAKKGATQAQIKAAQAAADEIMAVEKATQATKEQAKAEEEAQRILANIDPLERARQEYEKLLELKNRGLLTDEQVGIAYANAMEKVAAENQKTTGAMSENWKTFADNTQRTLSDVFYSGFDNVEKTFGDMLKRMAANAAAAKIAEALFGNNGKSGKDSNGLIGSLVVAGANWLFSANGNAFDGAGVAKFAAGGAFTNSIYASPTPFMFANGGEFNLGVMGEAGPEAVMPLTRGLDGKLGVRSQGGGMPKITNNITYAPVLNIDSRSDRAQIYQIVDAGIKRGNAELVERMYRNGQIPR
jgi:hypothetical protein